MPKSNRFYQAQMHRKVRELPFYKTDSEAVHLWIHLIMEVNSADGMVTTELGEYPVSRGQVITWGHMAHKTLQQSLSPMAKASGDFLHSAFSLCGGEA